MVSTSHPLFRSAFSPAISGRSIMMRKQEWREVRWLAQNHTVRDRSRVLTEGPGLPDCKTTALNYCETCLPVYMEPGQLLWVSCTSFLLYLQNKGLGLWLPRSFQLLHAMDQVLTPPLWPSSLFYPTFHSEFLRAVPSSYWATDVSLPKCHVMVAQPPHHLVNSSLHPCLPCLLAKCGYEKGSEPNKGRLPVGWPWKPKKPQRPL